MKQDTNTNQFNTLAEKPVGSLLMQYAIPAIVAMAASSVYNIIDGIFGVGTAFSRIIYTLVGVAGLYTISFYWFLDRD